MASSEGTAAKKAKCDDADGGAVGQAVLGFVDPENDASVHDDHLMTLIRALHRSDVTLSGVVALAGGALTGSDAHARKRGVGMLSELLTRLPKLAVEVSAVQHMCTFFRERLDDFQSAGPCLVGLRALFKHHASNLSGAEARAVVEQMWSVLHVPSMAQVGQAASMARSLAF